MADLSLLTCGDDVLLRVMEYLGPKHSCIGIGVTCRELHRLSRDDALWRAFWRTRCLFPSSDGSSEVGGDEICNTEEVHGAAWVFRHALREMGLQNNNMHKKGAAPPQSDAIHSHQSEAGETSLYAAYVQKHTAMKLTNLRVEPKGRLLNDEDLGQSYLRTPLCTQTWPGQLSLVVDEAIGNAGHNRRRVTCLNPAEVWCDDPSCDRARCGPRGCLRSYRFVPRDYSLSASGLARECSDRDYELFATFVKCSWCSVSYCNEHAEAIATRWISCDECGLNSCPDCFSQVFATPPSNYRCSVETAGKVCRRKLCWGCTWHVGRRKQHFARNIPGGDDYSRGNTSTIVTVKGTEVSDSNAQWEEVETCCSKCLRHVEFRWRELAHLQESFGGFVP
ncbi:hypothetical protein ACHAXT_005643 [Thalassiosira profunda]